MSHGPLPAVYGPWVLSCTDCCHLPKQMYTTVYPASHRPGKYVQTFGTFEVSLSATWGYQPVYDSSQVGRWHLANKESGCRVGGESIAEPCRLVSDEPLTCFFLFFIIIRAQTLWLSCCEKPTPHPFTSQCIYNEFQDRNKCRKMGDKGWKPCRISLSLPSKFWVL